MLTPEEIKAHLSDRNLREVARRTRLSYAQVYGLATGDVESPSYAAVEALSKYLSQTDR